MTIPRICLHVLVLTWAFVAVFPHRFPVGSITRHVLSPLRPGRHPSEAFALAAHEAHRVTLNLRGGEKQTSSDEERYSRQLYTLGARAHRLVRSSTVYLDGPTESGLMYECAKNLALSGVGRIVLVTSGREESDNENPPELLYFNPHLDDLGMAYGRAARAELDRDGSSEEGSVVLLEFIKRLNPSVQVSSLQRSELQSESIEGRGILVAVDRPQSIQVALNEMARNGELAFVAVETAGVYGRIFCDFGTSFEVFDADGETPLVVPLDHLENMEASEETLVVHVLEGEKHDVSKGDLIRFQLSSGDLSSVSCTVQHVDNPRRFTVRCDSVVAKDFAQTINGEGTSFSRIKVPQRVSFMSMRDALGEIHDNESLFTPCDLDKSFDPIRRSALMSAFASIESFVLEHSRLPGKQDTKAFRKLARSRVESSMADMKSFKSIVRSVCKTCAAKLAPIQAILGAISSQEVLKAASGLYNPIQQFILYDCDELLSPRDKSSPERGHDAVKVNSGQSYILGKSFCDSLAEKRLFVVGAGAIGCELLKNLAAMGVARGKGRVILTDMDTIEQSNLSRQLLFRDADIGKFKSTAAKEAVLRFDPSIQIDAHTSKVGDGEHGPFRGKFWSEKVDTVLNALDNIEARLFIDGQCVANRKALVDSGTLGPKGNVQVVVPFQSESYGSSADPPDPAIPLCTLKNFPYAISHTIQWGRDQFDGYFQRRPKQANDFIVEFLSEGSESFFSRLEQDLGDAEARNAASELVEDWALQSLARSGAPHELREASLQWAVSSARHLFRESILDLLDQHPIDSRDEDGELFWSGSRRVPTALALVESAASDTQQATVNENLIDFVRTAARLRIEMHQAASDVAIDTGFTKADATEALRDNWESIKDEQSSETGCIFDGLSAPSLKEASIYPLKTAEFEKDEETNGHVAFVTAASNLRALSYGIAPVDSMETRRVAGRIVPAMISTTAFVSGLSCVEFLKLAQNARLASHRNAFINLALPFFAFTQPLPAERMEGLKGTTYTIWDKIVLKESKRDASEGGLSLCKFLRLVLKKADADPNSFSVSSVSYGPYLIFTNFLHEDDESVLQKPVVELIKEAIQLGGDDDFAGRDEKLSATYNTAREVETVFDASSVQLAVIVEDLETGDEIEIPPVILQKRRSDIVNRTECKRNSLQ